MRGGELEKGKSEEIKTRRKGRKARACETERGNKRKREDKKRWKKRER